MTMPGSSAQTSWLRLTCLTFFRSLGGSLRALMISLTVTLRPFQSEVAFMMSSPTFFGDRPRGPILGARDDVAAISPPTHLRATSLISVGSNLGGIVVVL